MGIPRLNPLGMIINQLTDSGKAVIIDGISWRFPSRDILNALYVHLWAKYHCISFIFSLSISATLVVSTLPVVKLVR